MKVTSPEMVRLVVIVGMMNVGAASPTREMFSGSLGSVWMAMVRAALSVALTLAEARRIYREAYAGEPLVEVLDEAPWVSRIAGKHGAQVGGFTLAEDGRRLVVVSVLDNLLKGAATQAMQNLNLAFGLPELQGIPL